MNHDRQIFRWAKIICGAIALLCLWAFVNSAFGATRHVTVAGAGTESGADWDNALAGITAVNDSTDGGDTVYFGTGIYRGKLETVEGTAASPTVYACSAYTEGIASIWATDSVVGWSNVSGNVYRATWDHSSSNCYDLYDNPTNVVGQLDDEVDSLLIAQTDTPSAEGQYYHHGDTLFVWLYGDGDPGEDSISIEASCGYPVWYVGDTDHAKIWGFRLKYGNGACIRFSCGSDSNYVEHCTMSKIAGASGWNTGFIFSSDCDPKETNRDSSNVRFGNVVRACSLLWEVYEPGQSHAFALVYYSNWDAIIESCYVKGNYGTAAIHLKSNNFFPIIRHNYIDASIMTGVGNIAILLTGDYDYAQVYGNIIIGNGTHPSIGIDLKGGSGTQGDTSTYSRGCYVQNNTFVNVNTGIVRTATYGTSFHHVNDNYIRYNIAYLVPGANTFNSGGIIQNCRNDTLFWTIDYNMFYVLEGDSSFLYLNCGSCSDTCRITWAEWKTHGFDLNSSMGVYPDFADSTPGSYDLRRPNASGEMDTTYGDGWVATIFGALQNDDSLIQSLTAIETTTVSITVRNDLTVIGITPDSTIYQWSVDTFSTVTGADTSAYQDPDTTLIESLSSSTLYQIRAISWDSSESITDTSSTLAVLTESGILRMGLLK